MHRYLGLAFMIWSSGILAMTLVSIITVDWVHDYHVDTYVGLWKYCIEGKCTNFNGIEADYVKATQAFTIISCATSVLAIFMSLLVIKNEDGFENDKKGLASAFSLTAIFLAIAMTCFTTNYSLQYRSGYGYSFILGWAACGLSIIGSVVSKV